MAGKIPNAGKFLNVRLDERLKERISVRAKRANLSLTDYVIRLLDAATAEPYTPWPPRPGPRELKLGNDVFAQDSVYLRKLREAAGSGKTGDFTIRTTVPRALWLDGAELEAYRNWGTRIDTDLREALEDPRVQLRRLYIDEGEGPETEALRLKDEAFRQSLVGAEPKRRGRPTKKEDATAGRVEFRYATVRQLMGGPGLSADRDFLNDFNVYGNLAVSFTVETSFGVLFRCVVSRLIDDIEYWTARFDQLWNLSHPHGGVR